MKPGPAARVLAAAALLVLGAPAGAGVVPWPDAPFGYFANEARLETVLADFAAGFSLSLSMQPDVRGVVNGRFAAKSPTEFITKLAGVYGFVWYTHAGTLFVSRASDVVTRGVAAPGGNVAAMRKALGDLGVLEARFGWGELGDHGTAIVSGPPSYVQLIESTIRSLPARSRQLTVFRLKHASAEDRTVTYRDTQMKVPGLASILREMLSSGSLPTPGPAPAFTGGGVSGTMGAGGAANGGAAGTTAGGGHAPQPLRPAPALGAEAVAGAAATAAARNGPPPSVQAEPRLNAIIVQDLPERMPLYEQLIAQLDVPSPLVEIEAMIVDIATDRASELGVNWSGRIGKTSFGFGKESTTPGVGLLGFTSGSTAAGSFLISQLQALETRGEAEIHSRPSVLTSDNLAALLDLSETFYIRAQGERVATVTPITSGTTLRVTPHVLQQDGRTLVQLKIDIEDGRITEREVNALPTVVRTTVSTEATVMQGEALLIAGYASSNQFTSKQQLPLLGDIPVLGTLFSSKTRTVQKRERMFLIRPKVVGLLPETGTAGAPSEPVQASAAAPLAVPATLPVSPPKAQAVEEVGAPYRQEPMLPVAPWRHEPPLPVQPYRPTDAAPPSTGDPSPRPAPPAAAATVKAGASAAGAPPARADGTPSSRRRR